ncbi:MAG: mannosyltransferase family protein [bacterium]|nr:mannosyltransferase family protein [bacterium]
MRRFFDTIFADPAVRFVLMAWLVFRLATTLIAVMVYRVLPFSFAWETQPVYNLYHEIFTSQGLLRALIDAWYRWDTGWYLFIAHQGYSVNADAIIYPPLYPALIRLFAPVFGGDYLLSAIVISSVAAFFALLLLYKIAAALCGEPVARWTILLFITYPAAFFLMAGYTESLFLACVLGAWWMVMRQRYWLAGILALLAALTRSQGWTLALPFATMIYIAPNLENWGMLTAQLRTTMIALLRPLPAVLGGIAGTAAYVFGMRLAGFGSVEAQFASAQWKTSLVFPLQSVAEAVASLFDPAHPFFVSNVFNTLAFVLCVVMGVLMIRRLPLAYPLYVGVTLFFILLRSHADIELHGMLRYAVAIFPVFIMMALLLQGRSRPARLRRALVLAVGGGLQVIFLAQFVLWLWVS